MNRDFAEEYKKYADIDTPDLWSRIEAGVDALEETLKTAEEGTATEDSGKIISIASSPKYNNVTINTDNTEQKHIFSENMFAIFIRRYGGMIAAIACSIVVLSVMGITKLASDKNYSAAPAAESAAPAMEAPAAAEASDSYADEAEEYAAEATAEAATEEAYESEAAGETYAEATEEAYEAEEAVNFNDSKREMDYMAKAEDSDDDHAMVDEAPAAGATYAAGDNKDLSDSVNLKTANLQASGAFKLLEISARIESISKDPDSDMLICRLKVADPKTTGLSKSEVITVYADAAAKEAITAIQDKGIDKTMQYKVTMVNIDGRYILDKIE